MNSWKNLDEEEPDHSRPLGGQHAYVILRIEPPEYGYGHCKHYEYDIGYFEKYPSGHLKYNSIIRHESPIMLYRGYTYEWKYLYPEVREEK